MKLKGSCAAEEPTNKRKGNPHNERKDLANDLTDKWLISKIYKQFMQHNMKTNKQPNQKMGGRPK